MIVRPTVMESIFFSHAGGYNVVTDNPDFLNKALTVLPGFDRMFRIMVAVKGGVRSMSYKWDHEDAPAYPQIIAIRDPRPEQLAGMMLDDPVRFYLSEEIGANHIEVARGACAQDYRSEIWLYSDWHHMRKI